MTMTQKNRKKLYRVPVYWSMSGHYDVRAWNEEQAEEQVYNLPLPENGEFLDGSFETNEPIEINEPESDVKEKEERKVAEQEEKQEADSPVRVTNSDSLKEVFDRMIGKANGSV